MDNLVISYLVKCTLINQILYLSLNIFIIKWTNLFHKVYLPVFALNAIIFEAYIFYYLFRFEFKLYYIDLFVIASCVNFTIQLFIFLISNSMYTSLTIYLLINIKFDEKIIINDELSKFARHSAKVRFQRSGYEIKKNNKMGLINYSTKVIIFVQKLFQKMV